MQTYICEGRTNRVYFEERFKDTKGIIRSYKSKKKTDNTMTSEKAQKDKHGFTKHYKCTPLTTRVKLECDGKVYSSCSISCTRHITHIR